MQLAWNLAAPVLVVVGISSDGLESARRPLSASGGLGASVGGRLVQNLALVRGWHLEYALQRQSDFPHSPVVEVQAVLGIRAVLDGLLAVEGAGVVADSEVLGRPPVVIRRPE